MRSSRLRESTISPCCGILPPTSPVLPPCGTIAVAVAFGELQDFDHLGDRARPQHQRRLAVEHVAHLDHIGRLRLRIGDGVLLAHDRREAGEQGGIEGGG